MKKSLAIRMQIPQQIPTPGSLRQLFRSGASINSGPLIDCALSCTGWLNTFDVFNNVWIIRE